MALLASDDIYGQTFVDWFAFQALELDMEPVSIITYNASDNIESKLKEITQSGANALVCVPSSVNDVVPIYEYIENWNLNNPEYQDYITLMFSDKAYNKAVLNSNNPISFIKGIAPSSDPRSGFSVSYEALYGRIPYVGEAEVYDAVLTTVLASIWAEKNNETDLNRAIATLLNGNTKEQGGWTAGMINNYYNQIINGATPAISGATGSLDFNSEYYTAIRSTSYACWTTYNGKMVITDYYSRIGNGHSSSPVAAWEWRKEHVQDVVDSGKEYNYPVLNDNYAVLIAGSEGWKNYRHQADVLGFYQYLKSRGYDDDHIILIMADDIAN
ncbi:MAG: hypothetical protein IKU98_02320, partial [Bacteroidaceae bacterium]|nr:hypothetical protein [Bacteroidaceae bacterium]